MRLACGQVGREGGRRSRSRCRRRRWLVVWLPATVWSKFRSGVAVGHASTGSGIAIGKGLLVLPRLLLGRVARVAVAAKTCSFPREASVGSVMSSCLASVTITVVSVAVSKCHKGMIKMILDIGKLCAWQSNDLA